MNRRYCRCLNRNKLLLAVLKYEATWGPWVRPRWCRPGSLVLRGNPCCPRTIPDTDLWILQNHLENENNIVSFFILDQVSSLKGGVVLSDYAESALPTHPPIVNLQSREACGGNELTKVYFQLKLYFFQFTFKFVIKKLIRQWLPQPVALVKKKKKTLKSYRAQRSGEGVMQKGACVCVFESGTRRAHRRVSCCRLNRRVRAMNGICGHRKYYNTYYESRAAVVGRGAVPTSLDGISSQGCRRRRVRTRVGASRGRSRRFIEFFRDLVFLVTWLKFNPTLLNKCKASHPRERFKKQTGHDDGWPKREAFLTRPGGH